jgi:hypothetical protein
MDITQKKGIRIMSDDKLVTLSQVESVRQMANDKKVTRAQFQQALDDGTVARFLDGIKASVTDIIAPPGARLYTARVKVTLDRSWQEAVNAAGPNTPDNYNVRKVGDLYLPTGKGEVEEDLILLNYPEGDGSWDKALTWAGILRLKPTVPREVFAVGEQHPELHRTLGVNPMYVVATTKCTFDGSSRACGVWWRDAGREAYLSFVELFVGASAWFAFRK